MVHCLTSDRHGLNVESCVGIPHTILGGRGGGANIFVCGSGFRSTRAAFKNSSGFELAKVIPLHKKDDKMIMTNYMHISLLPFISKIIEKVAHNQISH